MLYNLNNPLQKEQFKRRCNKLYEKAAVVELSEPTKRRTLKQNSYLHIILEYFATQTGNRMDEIKQGLFKLKINRDLFLRWTDVGKERVPYIRSTRDLNEEEMSTAIDRFLIWSEQEAGIHLPSPEEKDFLDMAESEIERVKQYL